MRRIFKILYTDFLKKNIVCTGSEFTINMLHESSFVVLFQDIVNEVFY
jgi:hypothetical protein